MYLLFTCCLTYKKKSHRIYSEIKIKFCEKKKKKSHRIYPEIKINSFVKKKSSSFFVLTLTILYHFMKKFIFKKKKVVTILTAYCNLKSTITF